MVELSNERIEQILHEETTKKEESETVLRSIYTRYMRLFEKYFADIDALNDEKIAELKSYNEETLSLVRYYYLDIPQDVCSEIKEFEDEYTANLLGSGWNEYLSARYEKFKEENEDDDRSEEYLKARFQDQTLESFYYAMDYIFRESFGTGSKTTEDTLSGIAGLLFGKKE